VIADLVPYSAMKNSGVRWLGEVPEHWQVLPNRAVFSEIKERDQPDADMLSVTITRGVIQQRALLEGSSKKDSSNQDKSSYKLVRPGDIAYNKMRAWQGAVGASEYEGIVSPAYIVQRPRDSANPRYLHYLLRTPAFAKEAERWSYGITSDMWSLRPEHFKLIYLCLPPLTEQSAIVRILDHWDRRIRLYIEAKQKLIKLLEEQKQAIIHQAVTRGLNPKVRLKPSGVDWLGDVPEHWEVAALRRRWTVRDCKHLTVPFIEDEDGIPLASVREVQSFDLSLAQAKRTSRKYYESLIEGDRKPRKGDLIYCRNVSVGAAAVVTTDEPVAMGQDVCLIRSRSENQRYLNYFLRSPAMRHQLAMLLVGSTFNRINVADIKSLTVIVPPRNEQDAVADFLDVELEEAIRAQTVATDEIFLLREYRFRLIADVVTGKLDVAEAAARLPDDLEDTEPLDEVDATAEAEETLVDDLYVVGEETEA
jgi:type I restriction enzyme S subunit